MCWIHVYRFNIILKSFFVIQLHTEPYNKICFDIIHIHCNKQLFFILSLSIDITEEGSDVGDDSDDGDFELLPSLGVRRLSSVNFSHFKLLLRNHLADWNQT